MTGPTQSACIALGSNLGDRESHLKEAVQALSVIAGIAVHRCSAIYETDAVSSIEQGPYLNAVVLIDTSLSAEDLLEQCFAIERLAGREREGTRDAPRTLDLDLLFLGSRVSRDDVLELPHPRLHERAFVLVPLSEVAPTWHHPVEKQSVEGLLQRLSDRSGVRYWGNLQGSAS